MGPRPFGRGRLCPRCGKPWLGLLQWGRDLSAAEGALAGHAVGGAKPASMGPRPFGRGRRSSVRRPSRTSPSFNGAATFRPRKGLAHSRPNSRRPRFNGAATFRPRKAAGRPARRAMPQLQWGRDLSAAEGRVAPMRQVYAVQLQWGRDLSAAEGAYGAAVLGLDMPASMGPRPFGRGRCCTMSMGTSAASASMGPRPFGRGRTGGGSPHGGHAVASMGPRPFGRGRIDIETAINGAIKKLQWGRDLSAAEGRRPRTKLLGGRLLQWGRDLSAAEGPSTSAARP